MDNIGIDLHKRESQVCIEDAAGNVVLEQRIRTERDRFVALLGNRPRARVLIEASGESEWVARCIEELGHEVIIADPGYAPMYAYANRRVKTDRRDARTLADAARLGTFRRAHRTSDAQMNVRTELVVREKLVRMRAQAVVLAQALVRRNGLRVHPGTPENFAARLSEVAMPAELAAQLAPLLAVIAPLNEQIAKCDEQLEARVEENEGAKLLMTVPGVGPVTALAFAAAVDDPKRFQGPHQLQAYFGMVPSEMSSGERRARGHITKAGNSRIRYLLVQTALRIRRMKKASTFGLLTWSDRIAERRGKRIAMVALARRLAGIMFAMLRDKTTYQGGISGARRAKDVTPEEAAA